MAAATKEAFEVEAELIEGDHGVFDVAIDGHIVFSKQERGDFIPTPDVIDLLRKHLANRAG